MRITLDIIEGTTIIEALDLREDSLHLQLKQARKTNDSQTRAEVGAALADVALIRRKVKEVLASATVTNPQS